MALRERSIAAAPFSARERVLAAGLAAALAVVAIGVVLGAFTRFDQFALDHFMPWLIPGNSATAGHVGFWQPYTPHVANALKFVDLVTYPCSVLISGLVVVIAAVLLWNRLGPFAALAPAAAWVVGNAIEVVLKDTLLRPAVYGTVGPDRVHVVTFDHSFSSGHMMRGIIVAYTLTLLWRRASPWVWVWAASVAPALVIGSAHTPSDVIGGALLGLLVIMPVRAVVRQARLERRLV